MALTGKRQTFVTEYLRTWNASEAARIAGYAHPGSDGHRLLKISEIAEEIQRITHMDRVLAAGERNAAANEARKALMLERRRAAWRTKNGKEIDVQLGLEGL